MKAREQSFTTNTIVHAWKKCGIEWNENQQELKGLTVFTEADFAPSLNTSTCASVPPSYPQELPSDFDPWVGAEPEASGSDDPSEAQPAESNGYAAFQKTWNVGDGTSRADNSEEPEDDGGDNGVDGGDNGDDDGDDDEDDDGEEFTDEEGEGSEDNMMVEE